MAIKKPSSISKTGFSLISIRNVNYATVIAPAVASDNACRAVCNSEASAHELFSTDTVNTVPPVA